MKGIVFRIIRCLLHFIPVFALRISGVASRLEACPPRYYRFRGVESKAVGCWSIKKGTCEPKSVVPNFSGCIARSSMPYADVSFKIWVWYASCFATAFIQCRTPGRGVWHPKHRWCSRSRTGPFGAMQGAWIEKHHFRGEMMEGSIEESLYRTPKNWDKPNSCLHFNWRLSASIVQFHAGMSSDANNQSLVPATIGSINSCLYLFGSARYQGNRIIRVIVCCKRDFPRVKISET